MMRKRYTPAQKAAIVLELFKEEETLPQIASRHGVHPNLLRKWKAQALEGLPHLFTDEEQDRRAAAARVCAGMRTISGQTRNPFSSVGGNGFPVL